MRSRWRIPRATSSMGPDAVDRAPNSRGVFGWAIRLGVCSLSPTSRPVGRPFATGWVRYGGEPPTGVQHHRSIRFGTFENAESPLTNRAPARRELTSTIPSAKLAELS